MTIEELVKMFRRVKQDYEFHDDVMNEDDERVSRAKKALGKLPLEDRTIMVLYAECMSLRKLALILGVSHTTAEKEIRRIRKNLIEIYEHLH